LRTDLQDTLFPASNDDDDSDYDPNQDDQASDASSEDSDFDKDAAHPDPGGTHANVDDPNFNPDLPAHTPAAIAGVDGDNTTADPGATPGVDDETPGVDDETTGVDEEHDEEHDEANLETYVNELAAELDKEIAALDSGYDPEHPEYDIDLDNNVTPAVGENKIDEINAGATREQTNADNDLEHKEDSDNEHISGKDDNTPIPRLRRNRTPSFRHLKGRDGDGSLPTVARPHQFRGCKYQAHVILQSIIFTHQYNLKQGIQKFGDNGEAALLVELQQLYDRSVMDPINKYNLLAEERKGALRYLMFLKEKRCGTIKGRGCADGWKQRDYMTEQETSSPTVATEALLLSCVIDAVEERDVATCDIPGAFMQLDMKGKVVMKLEGVMAEVIIKIDSKKYTKYVAKENSKDMIYVILTKALYGTLQAALLFWQNLSGKLKKWGFKINPYDLCVANKTIDRKQCTVVWHVDDLKISHVDPKAVTTILNLLDAQYGQEIVSGKRAPLTITRGKIHDYLGMTLDYSEPGVVKINMVDYVKKILDKMPENMDGTATSPAAGHLFKITEGIEPVDEATSEFLHATVAKLLFLCKRGRPAILKRSPILSL
jgi:hypothetical protein